MNTCVLVVSSVQVCSSTSPVKLPHKNKGYKKTLVFFAMDVFEQSKDLCLFQKNFHTCIMVILANSLYINLYVVNYLVYIGLLYCRKKVQNSTNIPINGKYYKIQKYNVVLWYNLVYIIISGKNGMIEISGSHVQSIQKPIFCKGIFATARKCSS